MPKPVNTIYKMLYYRLVLASWTSSFANARLALEAEMCHQKPPRVCGTYFSSQRNVVGWYSTRLKPSSGHCLTQGYSVTPRATIIQGQERTQKPSPCFQFVTNLKSHPSARTQYGTAWDLDHSHSLTSPKPSHNPLHQHLRPRVCFLGNLKHPQTRRCSPVKQHCKYAFLLSTRPLLIWRLWPGMQPHPLILPE